MPVIAVWCRQKAGNFGHPTWSDFSLTNLGRASHKDLASQLATGAHRKTDALRKRSVFWNAPAVVLVTPESDEFDPADLRWRNVLNPDLRLADRLSIKHASSMICALPCEAGILLSSLSLMHDVNDVHSIEGRTRLGFVKQRRYVMMKRASSTEKGSTSVALLGKMRLDQPQQLAD